MDPHSVLEQLDPLVGQTGCVKSPKEVTKIVSLMKAAQLLVVRVVILNIIKATRAPSTLERLMAAGWPVLNVWLAEAKKTQDAAVLVEVMQVLQKLPVTVAALKQGNMGKLIKQLSKQERPEVKSLASDLLANWMAIFKEGQAVSKSKPASGSTPEAADRDKEKDKAPSAAKPQDSAPSTPTKTDKKEKAPSKKKEKSSKGAPNLPPVESKPPPGPLVALGRRDKPLKRPRDFPLKGQPPAEKKTRHLSNSDEKAKGKGPVESEGFMNALSSHAAKMKEKKRKVSKPKPLLLVARTGSVGGGEVDTPTPTSAEPQEPMDTSTPGEDQNCTSSHRLSGE
jgi:protein phosphatase 1 regulatory subunit 10